VRNFQLDVYAVPTSLEKPRRIIVVSNLTSSICFLLDSYFLNECIIIVNHGRKRVLCAIRQPGILGTVSLSRLLSLVTHPRLGQTVAMLVRQDSEKSTLTRLIRRVRLPKLIWNICGGRGLTVYLPNSWLRFEGDNPPLTFFLSFFRIQRTRTRIWSEISPTFSTFVSLETRTKKRKKKYIYIYIYIYPRAFEVKENLADTNCVGDPQINIF
jgi:hypothetical protein